MVRSYLWLILCVTLWGSNYVFGSILVKEFPPLLLSAIRLTITSLFLLVYSLYTKRLIRINSKDWILVILFGLIGILVNQSAFFTGLQYTDATTAALILSLTPITTSFLAAMFLGESLNRRILIGSGIAIIGVFLVLGKEVGIKLSLGVGLCFIAMLTFSISIILIRKLTERLDSITTTVYATLIGSIMLIPIALYLEPISHISHHFWAWGLVFFTAIVMQGICSLIWNHQLQQVGAGKATIFLNIQPFVAMIFGFLLLGTTISLFQIFGSFLIISGVIIATIKISQERKNDFGKKYSI